MPRWYFAYGSNLLRRQLYLRTGAPHADAPPPRGAWLPGYRLAFNMLGEDRCIYANIVAPGDGVPGVLYPLTGAGFATLDHFEQGYARLEVVVNDDSGAPCTATTYVALAEHVVPTGSPTRPYLERIIVGARDHGLPKEHIQFLENV